MAEEVVDVIYRWLGSPEADGSPPGGDTDA
jgi:hypothetical protein